MARVVVVGLGLQGLGIARLVLAQGHELVGAVEIDDRVGARLSDIVPGAVADAVVHGSISDCLEAAPEVAMLAAATTPAVTIDLATQLLGAGVNAITLAHELFHPTPDWATELDRIGRQTGASFLASGVQDLWWVHMVATAAGSTTDLRAVEIEHVVDLNSLSAEVGRWIGVGAPAAHPDGPADPAESVLGAPLRETARRLGLTPDQLTVQEIPVIAEAPTPWSAGGTVVGPGLVIGVEESSSLTTTEGVTLRGLLRTIPLAEGEWPYDRVLLDGEPRLQLEHRPFPGDAITNVVPVHRIPDVIEARGGVLSAGELDAPRYRHSATQAALIA